MTKDDEKMKFWLFFCIAFLALFVVIIYSLAVFYMIRSNKCIHNPAPWCYTDWKCLAEDGSEINMSDLTLFGKYGTIAMCQPITAANLHNFPYMDSDGVERVGDPGNEVNIWAKGSPGTNCTPEICTTKYTIGDVYWKACHGSDQSPYYTPYYNY